MKAEDCFHLKKLIFFFFSETKKKKKRRVTAAFVIRYLVRVAEFTDLPGNQVPLVVLHLHGADVLLARKEKEQKEEPTKHLSTGDKSAASGRAAASHWRTSSFFSFLFLLRGWLSES